MTHLWPLWGSPGTSPVPLAAGQPVVWWPAAADLPEAGTSPCPALPGTRTPLAGGHLARSASPRIPPPHRRCLLCERCCKQNECLHLFPFSFLYDLQTLCGYMTAAVKAPQHMAIVASCLSPILILITSAYCSTSAGTGAAGRLMYSLTDTSTETLTNQ